MKLRRAWWLCMGLSAAACGDATHDLPDFPDRTMDGGGTPIRGEDGGIITNPDGSGVANSRDRRSRLVSTPSNYALVGEDYSYSPKTNSKARSYEMTSAPEGMTLRNGVVRWTPTEAQTGTTRFSVRALGAGTTSSEQQLQITVAKSTLAAQGDVGAGGGDVYVEGNAPKRMLGLGMMVPARSVGGTTRMSVSELDLSPNAPNSSTRVRALRFGPTGQVFDAPARITLPLPEAVSYSRTRMGVYVYDPAGRWQRVPMVALDLANGMVSAKAQHFSVYAAIQSSLDMEATLGLLTRGACEGSLLARAVVTSPLSELALDSINNLSSELAALVSPDASVQDLLAQPSFRGSLRAVQVLELVEGSEGNEVVRDRRLLVTTLFVPGTGSATVTHSDELGNVLASKSYTTPSAELTDIAARLRGAASAASFAGDSAGMLGLSARLHLSYFEGDASQEPVSAEDLGVAAVESAPSFGMPGNASIGDVDCDGTIDTFDTSDDSLASSIEASPRAVASVFVGDKITLSARVLHAAANTTGSWTLLDSEGGALAGIDGVADARSFSASAAGRYLVSYRVDNTTPTLEHVFAIDVAERVADQPLPACQPSRAVDIGRVGEAVVLSAIVGRTDRPRDALSVQWGLVDTTASAPVLTPASTILARGDKALFSPLEGGNFTVGCRVFDGVSYGALGTVELSVVPRASNRAPVDLVLTPSVMNMAVGDELKLHASASDLDGDALRFEWDADGSVVTEPSSDSDESYLTITPAAAGKVRVRVRVSDGKAPDVEAVATILVGSAPVSTVDVDMDGWSPGTGPLADCDDNNANVHPTAVDLCGDRVDSDCDGRIEVDDCDYDGYTIARGDCDDTNPRRHPGATELCDRIDNNCNQAIDEGFFVGDTCSTGMGGCVNRGLIECSADGLTQLCAAKPVVPTQEVCDGADNDCDGLYDEENVCGVSDGGVTGTVDAEVCYAVPEVCTDGKDNDCDGNVDSKDLDCQAPQVMADSCRNVVPIVPGKAFTGSFENSAVDFASSCSSDPDLVFSFTLKETSLVGVVGPTTSAWSIQSGSCDANNEKLNETYCARDFTGKTTRTLAPGEYFLVIKGTKGTFTMTLNAVSG